MTILIVTSAFIDYGTVYIGGVMTSLSLSALKEDPMQIALYVIGGTRCHRLQKI